MTRTIGSALLAVLQICISAMAYTASEFTLTMSLLRQSLGRSFFGLRDILLWQREYRVLPARLIKSRRYCMARKANTSTHWKSCRQHTFIRVHYSSWFRFLRGCSRRITTKAQSTWRQFAKSYNSVWSHHQNARQCRRSKKRRRYHQTGAPEASHLGTVPVWDGKKWVPWHKLCRGGARDGPDAELLEGLLSLLDKIQQKHSPSPRQEHHRTSRDAGKGKGKGKDKGKDGPVPQPDKSKTQTQRAGKHTHDHTKLTKDSAEGQPQEGSLLKALERLVRRAQTNPKGLVERLQKLCHAAAQGKSTASGRAERKRKAKLKRVQPAAQAPSNEISRETTSPPSGPSSWAQVVSRRGHAPRPPVRRDTEKTAKVTCTWKVDLKANRAVNCATARKDLEQSAPLNVAYVVCRSLQEIKDLQRLASIFELKDAKVGLICQCEYLEDDYESHTLQSIDNSGRKGVRDWKVVPLYRELPNAPTGLVRTSTFSAPTREVSTLRVLIPREFLETDVWKNALAKPNDFVQTHIGAFLSASRWKHEITNNKGSTEELLEGYIRIDASQHEALLRKSGAGGVFCERLARDSIKQMVQWIPKQCEGPAYLKVAQQKSGSLAFRKGGGANLGLRLAAGEHPERTSTWKVRHVPNSWAMEDLQQALLGANFNDVKILSRGAAQRPWLVQTHTKKDAGEAALAIKVGQVYLHLERSQPKRRLEVKSEAWLRPRAQGPLKSPCDSTPDKEANPMEVSLEKKPLEDALSEQASKKVKTHEKWYDLLECGGAGHCFFNCVATAWGMTKDNLDLDTLKPEIPNRGRQLRGSLAVQT